MQQTFDPNLFRPRMREFLAQNNIHDVMDVLTLDTNGEMDDILNRAANTWGIGALQVERMRGYVAGVVAMGEYLTKVSGK